MDAREILGAMRHGERPAPEALRWFAQGLASGQVSDAQAGAFAMAACLNGLGDAGRVALTEAMRNSGEVLGWDLPGPVVDKHSTGGIGDPVSLVLAPALAAAGCFVPMISGRGLGHTGGTLDKLEAIPGLSVDLDRDRFGTVVRETGLAIVAATGQIAPADKRLYAVRDVTGTVDHIDLITASILSKKLAGGIGALVLDVKVGSGAFMADEASARELAQALVDTARGAGCETAALITDMDQPLAPAIGNAVEIAEVMAVLTGAKGGPLREVSLALGGRLLALGGVEPDPGTGAARLASTLEDGSAAERFAAMVAAMGGPSDFAASWQDDLPDAPVIRPVTAETGGHVGAIDGIALGMASVRLGGGRQVEGDRIDPAVGLSALPRIGDAVAAGDPLAVIHAADDAAWERAATALRAAITLTDTAPTPPALIRQEIA